MRRSISHSISCCCLAAHLAAPPAYGQTPSKQSSDALPADALQPNAEAQEFFKLIEALAKTGKKFPPFPPEATAEFEKVAAQTYRRGDKVSNWSSMGLDIIAKVAAADGGVQGNMLLAQGKFGPTAMFVGYRPLSSLIQQDWRPLARFSHRLTGRGEVLIGIAHISPKVVVVDRGVYERRGNALCRIGGDTKLFGIPKMAASEMDTIAYAMAPYTFEDPKWRSLCTVTVEAKPGIYKTRFFEAGFALPELDAEADGYRIVPAAPIWRHATPGRPAQSAGHRSVD